MHKWLENIKVGDKVLRYAGTNTGPSIGTVERLTKTQIEVRFNSGYTEKFNIKSGRRVGDTSAWHTAYIDEYDQAVIEELKLKNKRRDILNRMTEFNKVRTALSKLQEEDLNRLENLLESFFI